MDCKSPVHAARTRHRAVSAMVQKAVENISTVVEKTDASGKRSVKENKPKLRRVVLIIDPTTQAIRRVESIHEASRVTGVSVISIWRGCHGLRHCSRGLVFRFADACATVSRKLI